ncbi:MAG: type II toxin-antitoxin system Phd/YefM family antitoxin [Candidatus Xenobia bacterium]
MITVTFSDLRNNAKKYFDAVERGETVEVYRHGKPVALLSPLPSGSRSADRWKTASPLEVDGASLTQALLEDRQARG